MNLSKKIVLLGHFGVGKTSLIRRFVDNAFSEDYLVTVGVHIKKKEVTIKDTTFNLIIWDVEGNTSIEKARSSYLLGTHGFFYVFDVTRPETYENLTEELKYLDSHFPNVPYTLVGNKYDLIENENLEDFFAQQTLFKNCKFTSAKTGNNVEEIFTSLASKLL